MVDKLQTNPQPDKPRMLKPQMTKSPQSVIRGTIARLTDRGFGFVTPEDGGRDIFFHARELQGVQYNDLKEGVSVEFDAIETSRGPAAVNLTRSSAEEIAGEINTEELADDAATEELASDADTEELADDASTGIRAAINDLSEKLARFVAKNPETLDRLEWRDLERVVAEVFAGLGFEVELTPGSKDGGKDVVVSFHHAGKKSSYLIEVKHWLDTRVGYAVVSRFVHVVARDGGSGGLFLSTRGYSKTVFERIMEIEQSRVRLGTERKIISLCRRYVRSKDGTWYSPKLLGEIISEDTEEAAEAQGTSANSRGKDRIKRGN